MYLGGIDPKSYSPLDGKYTPRFPCQDGKLANETVFQAYLYIFNKLNDQKLSVISGQIIGHRACNAHQGSFGGKDLVLAWLRVLVCFWAISVLPAAASATIGKVLSVKQGAELVRGGKITRLQEGMEIASGDTITTDRSGVVQLIFADETKIAVGPNARMVLDVSMLRGKRKASSFAVEALGGSFRFISGNSRKRAYSVKTPTATMAVRGTIFDMWVASGQQSAMLVLEGTVLMCGQSGSCRSARRQCSMFATSSGGGVGRPADQDQYFNALESGFPFIQSESQLLPPFQANGEACGRDVAVAPRIEPDRPEVRQVREVQRSAPPAPEPEVKKAVEKPEKTKKESKPKEAKTKEKTTMDSLGDSLKDSISDEGDGWKARRMSRLHQDPGLFRSGTPEAPVVIARQVCIPRSQGS